MNQNLINAVVEQLGYDEIDAECRDVLQDVSRHGADAGLGDDDTLVGNALAWFALEEVARHITE